ncbi:MAG TPA: tape measure protein, partial [Xanthomonadaceae bacterium]|nr:tape measure protein [Xanthomonadaceae bacterium]
MATRHELVIKLTADGKGLIGEVRTAGGEVRKFATEADQAGDRAAAGFGKARQGVESISAQLQRARAEILGFLGIRIGAQMLGDLVNVADEWGQLSSRIGLATDSLAEHERVQERLQAISRVSYRAIEETTEVFLRSAGAMREVGFASEQTLDMVEAVSLGLVVSATNAQTGTSVIEQFGKAMELGALRGETFNTVIAGAPALADALAKGLGVTRGALRRMAEEGALTADVVLPALSSQLDDLRSKAEAMPTTVGDAWTVLRNRFVKWLGTANEATGVTRGIAAGIELLANNLDVLFVIAGSLTALFATRLLVTLGAKALAWAANTVEAIKYQVALAKMTGVSTAAAASQVALAAATKAAGAALGASAVAANKSGLAFVTLSAGPIAGLVAAIGGVGIAYYAMARYVDRVEREAIAASAQRVRERAELIQRYIEQQDRLRQETPAIIERELEAAERLFRRAMALGQTQEADRLRGEIAGLRAELRQVSPEWRAAGEAADVLTERLRQQVGVLEAQVRGVDANSAAAIRLAMRQIDATRLTEEQRQAVMALLKQLDGLEKQIADGARAEAAAKAAREAHAKAVANLASVYSEMERRYDEAAAVATRYGEMEA